MKVTATAGVDIPDALHNEDAIQRIRHALGI